ncbi:hypothetical protein EBT31_07575 [bacterium]|nr:hypothetical protein [bacterium]
MGNRANAEVGVSFTTSATFKLRGTLVDVIVEYVELLDPYGVVAQTDAAPVRVSTGVFRASFEAVTVGGDYVDVWYYRNVEGGELLTFRGAVPVADAVVSETDAAVDSDDDLLVGSDGLCTLTVQVADAGGHPIRGVLARFTPDTPMSLATDALLISGNVQAESSVDGTLSLSLMRGAVGMLSISHIGLVRQVTVPDQAECTLQELISSGTDYLSVQEGPWIDLPKV